MKTTLPQTLPNLPATARIGAPSERAKGVALMAGAVLAFTASVLLLRGAIEGNVWLATCVRYAIGLTIVSAIYLPSKRFKPLQLFRNPDLIMRGVLGSVGVFLFYATIPHLGAGVSTFVSTTYVVLAPLIARVYLKETLTPKQIFFMALAMIGMFVMTGVAGAETPPWLYVGVGLIGATLAAMVVVYIRKLASVEHGSTIYAAQCFFGLLIGCGPALMQYDAAASGSIDLTPLVLSGVLASAGQLMMTFGYKYLPVAEGGLLALCAPVGIMFGGILLYGEACSADRVAGAGLILGASVFTTRSRPSR